MKTDTMRILAADVLMSNNTRATGLNNNDLIVGPSGAGKTRGYVEPNLLQCEESVIVADTKGALYGELRDHMRRRGYRVMNIDFTDLQGSCGYNPLDYIRYDPERDKYSEQDILTICACLVPIEDSTQPFWEMAARTYLASLIGYVLERLPQEEHTLEYVAQLFTEMGTGRLDKLMEILGHENPNSFAYRKYSMYRDNKKAEKMYESIRGILAEKLDPLTFDGAISLYSSENRLDLTSLGREKTAVFLTVSDTDRSLDRLVNLFYTQALQALCRSADRDYRDHRLPVPVRFIFDDFATNTVIPDFDNIISVIRSREIYVSVIVQSLSQLRGLYGNAKAMTIVNNCDNCLYLGGQDVETAKYFAIKANKTPDTILNMPLDAAYLFTRGSVPRRVKKFELTSHEAYAYLKEISEEACVENSGRGPSGEAMTA